MDTVFISNLRLDATIGVFDWEKKIKQPLVFDLEMAWDISEAAASDDLTKALDYAAVSQVIEEYVASNIVELVETLADRLAEHLMNQFGISWLKLKVCKPDAVPKASGVGVIIERGSKS